MFKALKLFFLLFVSVCALDLYAQKDIQYTMPRYEMGWIDEYPITFIANDDSIVVESENTGQTFVLDMSGNGFHYCSLDLNHDGYKDYYFYSDFGGQRDFNCVMIFNPSLRKFEEYDCADCIAIDNIIVIPQLKKTYVCYYSDCTYHYAAIKFENGLIKNDGLMWVTHWDPVEQKEYHGYYDPEKDEIVKKISAKKSIYKDVIKLYKSLGIS